MRLKVVQEEQGEKVKGTLAINIKAGMVFYVDEFRGVTGKNMRLLALTDAYFAGNEHWNIHVLWLGGGRNRSSPHESFDIVSVENDQKGHTGHSSYSKRANILGVVEDLAITVGKVEKYDG